MSNEEIKENIKRLEHTIGLNLWNKGYVANCNRYIESYKKNVGRKFSAGITN